MYGAACRLRQCVALDLHCGTLLKRAATPAGAVQQYGEVAAGLKQCLGHMGPWSVMDLTLGVRHVGQRHDAHNISDNLFGNVVTLASYPRLFEYLHTEIAFARAAYAIPDVAAIAAAIATGGGGGGDVHVALVHPAAARFKPAHYVAVDSASRLVRVAVRGTKEVSDVLTDIAGHWEPYGARGEGQVHSGFLRSAEWVLQEEAELLVQLLNAHPGRAPTLLLGPCPPVGVIVSRTITEIIVHARDSGSCLPQH
jgi:Lipase (class 3)